MTKELTIGIPKGLFYFQFQQFWEYFFQQLGIKTIVSADTNKSIFDNGVKLSNNETCLPVKIFLGHVSSLLPQVDYVFVPRYTSIASNEYTCPKFCGLPNMVYYNLKKQVNILEIKILLDEDIEDTVGSLLEFADKLGLSAKKVVDTFFEAVAKYREEQQTIPDAITNLKEDKGTIAVLGHPYMIYDNYLSMQLLKKLEAKGLRVLTNKDLDHRTKRENAYPYQGRAFWDIGLDNLGSAFTFANAKKVAGVIYLTPFACGIDSFIMEFIERQYKANYKMPYLKLTVDEHTGEAGFDTRIEAFLDMIG